MCARRIHDSVFTYTDAATMLVSVDERTCVIYRIKKGETPLMILTDEQLLENRLSYTYDYA